jgi:hypothetical protein
MGTLTGTILSSDSRPIEGARVSLQSPSLPTRTVNSNDNGFFSLDDLPAGTWTLSVTASGFNSLVQNNITIKLGQQLDLPALTLTLATVTSSVDALTQRQEAMREVKIEEHQRVLGIIPNFYVTYEAHPAPLSAGQKFHLAYRTFIDPTTFAFSAAIAGIEQQNDSFSGFGRGPSGYGKRFGATTGDALSATFFGGAIYPALFHQDPRYFYKGTGSVRSRLLYALASSIRTPADNGHWQPNYSFIAGNFTAGALSNAYYPAANRGAGLTITNALLTTASASVGAVIEEFFLSHITTKPKE